MVELKISKTVASVGGFLNAVASARRRKGAILDELVAASVKQAIDASRPA